MEGFGKRIPGQAPEAVSSLVCFQMRTPVMTCKCVCGVGDVVIVLYF